MSANFDDDVTGPFDGGPFDEGADERWQPPGGSEGVPRQRGVSRFEDSYRPQHDGDLMIDGRRRRPEPVPVEASGLEAIGGVLFLAGCLPAAAVAKAIADGTNLAAPGLGGTAALAAKVAHWLGPWSAFLTCAAIAVLGALMVLGTLRTEPLRRVAGVLVCGLGFSAVMGALSSGPTQGLVGAGGQIGFGTGGALATSLGSWAGVLLGLAVIGGAVWLGFVSSAPEVDEDDGLGPIIERDELPSTSAGSALAKAAGAAASVGAAAAAAGASIFKREPRPESEVLKGRAKRQRRVSNKKVRRPGAPVTLGDALARGGTEGVTHDEAAALAPDDKTLAYMEDVWRRASHSMEQPGPIPPSPYPEDVRLKGQIPDGAAPLVARPGQPEAAESPAGHGAGSTPGAAHMAPAGGSPGAAPPASAPQAPYAASHGAPPSIAPGDHVAPFDFEDELSAPKPLNQVPPAATPKAQPQEPTFGESKATDPFGGTGSHSGLTAEEAAAYESAILREGASATGPSELPHGVTPFVPKPSEAEDTDAQGVGVSSHQAEPQAEASVTEVPQPSDMGTTVPGANTTYFSGTEDTVAGDPVSKQAMQAGAMPASVSPPPRPAWEQGYDDEDDGAPVNLSPDLLETIPEVDESGRWQRREDGMDAEEQAGSSDVDAPSMSVLDELLAQVEASETALTAAEAEVEPEAEPGPAVEAELEPEPEPEVQAEIEAQVEPETAVEEEAEADLEEVVEAVVVEPESEPEEAEAELDEDVDAEVEVADEARDDEADDEEVEYEEYEEDAELEEGEEVEYEYVDEDGNPIDPEDLDGEYEFVEVAEDEDEADAEEDDEDEDAEYEEYDEDDEEDEEAEEAAEYEEVDEEESEPEDGEAEYEEYEDADVDDEQDEDAEDVILEPQAPPAPEPAPVAEVASEDAPGDELEAAADLSGDGQRLLEAGRLVVTKDRAAVSVIQKGFDVEFAEACSILEALFAEGLIGPYQEGKKRAILMSLEEWEDRFAHS